SAPARRKPDRAKPLDRPAAACGQAPYPTHMESANSAYFLSPIPDTRLRSSMVENGPLASRSATILAAVDGPTPGKTSSSSAEAVLMFTLPPPVPADPDDADPPESA